MITQNPQAWAKMNSREVIGGQPGYLNNSQGQTHSDYMQNKYSSTGIGPTQSNHLNKNQDEYTSKFGREYMKNQAE